MKILMVSQMLPYLPCYDGFRLIPAHLLRGLTKIHDVHLVAFTNGREDADQLAWAGHLCRSVLHLPAEGGGLLSQAVVRKPPFSSRTIEAVRARILEVRPDVLHLEGPSLAPLPSLAGFNGPTVLSAHDSLSLRYDEFARFAGSWRSRFLNRVHAVVARRFERAWYPLLDRVIVTSSADAQALTHCVPRQQLQIIPNGVDLEYLEFRETMQPGRLIFTGNMSWPPNIDAVRHFACDIFPLVQAHAPSAEFWIVGADPVPDVLELGERPGVHVTGTVPDLRPCVWSSAVYVSPLRFGAGVKNKILEAMALGTPIVATPKSITGTPLVHNRHLLLTETPGEMAEAVVTLLQNDALRHALAKEARREVELNYTWQSVAHRFSQVARALCDARTAAGLYGESRA